MLMAEMAAENAADLVSSQNEMIRPVADFPECIWADRFEPIVVDEQALEMQIKEIETLKEEVRSMLIKVKEGTTIEKLNLIDTVEQLGISYHFENEIDFLLEQLFLQNASLDHQENDLQNDLYATALLFRLLRQHGFNISSGIFFQFLNTNGNFEESLSNDEKGILSLYQAACVRTLHESILEEAFSFATTHLKSRKHVMSSLLTKQVNHALEHPQHRNVPRVEARHYMSIYEEDEAKSPLLLRLAKLDYYHSQILYRKELDELFSWREGLNAIISKVEYSRNRLIECYFWGMAFFFEPQYSLCRIVCTKTLAFLSILDDTYDSYGTLDELKLFKDALERWDVHKIDGLPEYMKAIYIGLLNFCEWIDEELAKQGKSRSHALSKFKEEWKQYVKTSYTESVWFLKRELPTFEDYKEIAGVTSTYFVVSTASFLFLDSATKDVFDWSAGNPKILVATSHFVRFLNDVASYEREKQKRATGLDCYMKQYNASEEEAMRKFEEISEEARKNINEELLRLAEAVPREILMSILNFTRVSDVTYKNRHDGYTYPAQNLHPLIVAVFLDLILV